MSCPPTKRPRRLNDDVAMASDDPFGDDEFFTQDDLDEIDDITSQAFPQGQHKSVSSPMAGCSRSNTFGFSSCGKGLPSREPLVNRPQQFMSDRKDTYSVLEIQLAELKRKLKEVEEEIMLKNGEIRVLRDSLKGAQQEKEAQTQTQMLLEIQRQKEQNDKEKELKKKVLSLQTELQFKEAEINEMKSKLHSSEKKRTASLLSSHSPKMQSLLTHLNDGSGSTPFPVASGFITKKLPTKPAPEKTGEQGNGGAFSSKQKTSPDPFVSKRPAPLQFQGSILLGLLVQEPLFPSSLGLSHLLSMSLTSSGVSTGIQQHSHAAVGGNKSKASLSQVQTLALNGLNMLSQSQTQVSSSTKEKSSCLGAVLFLPLVDYHLCRLSACLESLSSSTAGGSESAATRSIALTNIAPADDLGKLEGTGFAGFGVEEIGLAVLRLLYLLASHSDKVVEAVLSKESLSTDEVQKDSVVGLCSQNALLQSLLQLCESGNGNSIGSQMEKLVLSALKTLCVLTQRARHTHNNCLKYMLVRMGTCFSTDCGLRLVSEYVRVLMSLCDQPNLAQHLCRQHNNCVLLKLLQFIRTRRDNQATQQDWIQLDLLVVRLLRRMTMQRLESWLTGQHSSCQCHTELVQTMVIVFHRQWLDICGSQQPTTSTGRDSPLPRWHGTAASLLRECLLLLHWLLLHHSSFSESCRPLLHMYDQVIPAVQDILRRIPEQTESEEAALEEICRSDGDEADDVDIHTAS